MSTKSAIRARSEWLAHLRYCTRCPTDLCDRGEELAAAVRDSMAPGETWQCVYVPKDRYQWPRSSKREARDGPD